MEQTLEQLAARLKGRVIGDAKTLIRGVSSLDRAQPGEIAFVEGAKQLAFATQSKASALIVAAEATVADLRGKPGIVVENPRLAFAVALDIFYPQPVHTPGIHPTAVLGKNVQLGEGVSIRPHAEIGDEVMIGAGTLIEAGVHVGPGTTIGEQCFIAPNVVIYRHTRIGDRVRIHGGSVIGADGFGYVLHQGQYVKIPQVGNVIIEDDVELGANVCVDRATIGSTVIGRGTKVDNGVQIAHNDRIGKHVILTGHVGLSGSVTIGDYAMLGGKAGVVDHITIGAQAKVGAASVVIRDVAPGQSVWGYPARDMHETKKQMAALARLPEFMRKLAKLLSREAK